MLGKKLSDSGHDIFFLGNYYGYHDGYDGSIFSTGGISPGLVASNGRIPHIFVKVKTNGKRNIKVK